MKERRGRGEENKEWRGGKKIEWMREGRREERVEERRYSGGGSGGEKRERVEERRESPKSGGG